MKKITKTKTIDGSIWYYLVEADEKEERESPPQRISEKILRLVMMDNSVDLADSLMQKDEEEDENSGMTTLMS